MTGEKITSDIALVKALDNTEKVAPGESTLLIEIAGGSMVGVIDGCDIDSEDLDIEEDNEEIWSTKPSHVVFGKSTIGTSHIEVLKNRRCVNDIDLVCFGGEETTPEPKDNEVVIFLSFLDVAFRFPLHKCSGC